MIRLLAVAIALVGAGCTSEPQPTKAAQQQPAAGHSDHDSSSGGRAASGPAAKAYDEAMTRMHRDMGQASDDADESFARMMIPHHQGAIEMAEIVLKHGKDPEMRRLAQEVVAAQGREIRQMRDWLAKRGQQPAAPHAGH